MYERRRQTAWDRRNLVTVSSRVPKPQKKLATQYALNRGVTLYHLIGEYVQSIAQIQLQRNTPNQETKEDATVWMPQYWGRSVP